MEITKAYLAKQADEITLQQADVVLVLEQEDGERGAAVPGWWPDGGGVDPRVSPHEGPELARCGQLALSQAPQTRLLHLLTVGLARSEALQPLPPGPLQRSLSYRIRTSFSVVLCPQREEGGCAPPGGPEAGRDALSR